jgi:hypothetical protein
MNTIRSFAAKLQHTTLLERATLGHGSKNQRNTPHARTPSIPQTAKVPVEIGQTAPEQH